MSSIQVAIGRIITRKAYRADAGTSTPARGAYRRNCNASFWRLMPGAFLAFAFGTAPAHTGARMAAMKAADPRVTYAELQQWPDDGRRYELYGGEVIVVPAPLPIHQVVVLRVYDQLKQYADATSGLALLSPLTSCSLSTMRVASSLSVCSTPRHSRRRRCPGCVRHLAIGSRFSDSPRFTGTQAPRTRALAAPGAHPGTGPSAGLLAPV